MNTAREGGSRSGGVSRGSVTGGGPSEPAGPVRSSDRTRGRGVPGGRPPGLALLLAPGQAPSPAARLAVYVLTAAGAVLLAWSGLIHLRLWADGYSDIATIGPLFLAQGVGSLVIAGALVLLRRLVLILAGAVTMAATAAGLLLTVHVGLFGYRESLAVPYAQSSLIIEFTGAAVLLLAAVILAVFAGRTGTESGR